MRDENKPFEYTDEDLYCYASVYDIPLDIVKNIMKQKKTYTSSFFEWLTSGMTAGEWQDNCTEKEYRDMILGASIAYHNQALMGRVIPGNDERAVKINRFLSDMKCAIQYHPQHGMQIVDDYRNVQ